MHMDDRLGFSAIKVTEDCRMDFAWSIEKGKKRQREEVHLQAGDWIMRQDDGIQGCLKSSVKK